MDTKLATYRNKKRKKEMIESAKSKLKEFLLLWKRFFIKSPETKAEAEDLVKLQPQDSDDQESIQSEESIEAPPPENSLVTWTIYFLYFLLWATLYALALRLEFGAVYFILSSFYLIWANTRSGPKKEGEISAYSVFNPDCQSIDGTLKAEQFEREIMFGAASLH
ncbi:SAYSvFN domain-containing protein 1 [Belonocnema kinseyi]|uniref:SAYSvFN domain-containing protein 1 n=1 Tax=Belonocnema kinseyi TaxID=2817044 RepID=UPI00143DF3D5|nr:SAYSvFN domain-containing protein 1 [Belonocnema kinseyi]